MALRVARIAGQLSTATPSLRVAQIAGSLSTSLATLRLTRISGVLTPASVDAGPDLTIDPWLPATLTGEATGPALWTQESGSPVTLATPTQPSCAFNAPAGTLAGETLTFKLTSGAVSDTVTVTVRPAAIRRRTAGVWVPKRRSRRVGGVWVDMAGTPVTIASMRAAMLTGVTKPNPLLVGAYGIDTYAQVTPLAGSTQCTITSNGPHIGKEFWGRVKWGPAVTPVFDRCIFHGPDPDLFQTAGTLNGCVENFPTGGGLAMFTDCTFDPAGWLTAAAPGGARALLSPYAIGLYGSNFIIDRCEITNVHDGWEVIGDDKMQGVARRSWFHHGYYRNDTYPPADGQPHADGIQANTGRNILIEGNLIGGSRVQTGYLTWPGGSNQGDDFWDAAIMIGQEINNSDANLLTNWIIRNNWLAGGGHTLNTDTKWGTAKQNDFAGVTITGNRFARRASNDGDWLKGSGPGSTPVLQPVGMGAYIIRSASRFAGTITGNVYEDTGQLVPITSGN